MANEKSSRSKSQTLSLRLDPKTRFVLEFVAKLRRQSITTVVEEAIRSAGETASVGGEFDAPRTWLSFWDVSEGVRTLFLLSDGEVPSTYDDDELRDFIHQHMPFFSETGDLRNPDRINVHVLWPHIDRYLEKWRRTKETDPFQVGREMIEALRSAGVVPPMQWPGRTKALPSLPPRASARPPTAAPPAALSDLDDEIPF